MPESVAAWLATNTLTASSVLTASQITTLTYIGFAVAAVSYGSHQRRKAQRAARDRFNSGLEDRLIMTTTAQGARSRVYGRVRLVDGVVYKGTHGPDSQFYTLVVALAGHEIDAVETVYFDDKPVTLDGNGYVQTAPWFVARNETAEDTMTVSGGSGSKVLAHTPVGGSVRLSFTVGSGESEHTTTVAPTSVVGATVTLTGAPNDGTWKVHYQYATGDSKARVRAYLGAAGQDLYPVLQPLVGSAVQPSDKFAGLACLVVTLEFDTDAYPTGVPNISAVVRGARVFDPRTSTTAWTQNPALIARDWSLYAHGGGCVSGELNEPSFTAAANACDVSTNFSTPAGVQTRPLYQCGIAIPLDGSGPDQWLDEICESMAGQWGWAGGKLSVRAGVYRAPVATITEDWVTGEADIQIIQSTATAEAVNVMRPTFADAAQGWVSAPGPEVRAAAYITADGRELPRELDLAGVTHSVHAQHVCAVLMREARESLTVVLPCNLRAYQLELFDVVALTLPRFGFSAKLFEVVGWEFTLTGGVQLTLRETAAAIYQPDASFALIGVSDNTLLPGPGDVPQLTGLAASSGTTAQADGTVVTRTTVTWTAPASAAVLQAGRVEVQYIEAAAALPAGDWPQLPPAAGNATRTDVYGLRLNVGYLLRGRFRNASGVAGPWSLHILHVVEGRRRAKVFRQTAAPTGDVIDGDQWFDTDDGNRHYLREGGSWVAVPVGTGGLAAQAATAIQSTTVDSHSISLPTGSGEGQQIILAETTIGPFGENTPVEVIFTAYRRLESSSGVASSAGASAAFHFVRLYQNGAFWFNFPDAADNVNDHVGSVPAGVPVQAQHALSRTVTLAAGVVLKAESVWSVRKPGAGENLTAITKALHLRLTAVRR